MFRQLSNSSNVLTLRMERYPLSELTAASSCVPGMLAGQFEHLGGRLLNIASQTLIGFGTFFGFEVDLECPDPSLKTLSDWAQNPNPPRSMGQ